MLGSLQKKGNAFYVVFDQGRDDKGKRKQKWVSLGTDDSKIAEAKYADMVKKINAGEYLEPAKMTVAEFLDQWLEQYAKNNVRKSTYDSCVWVIKKHINPAIGHLTLAKLKPLHIQSMLNQSIKNLSAASVHKQYAVLRQALDQGIKWQVCTSNPCEAVTPPRREKYKGNVLTPVQLQILIDLASGSKTYLPINLAVTCGLRRGEVCGLRWQDVDFEKGLLFVRHSLDWEDSKLKLRPVKTTSSERCVKLPQMMLEDLKKAKRRQAEDKLRAGGLYNDQDYVWAWDDGRPHDPDYLYSTFQKMLKRYNTKIENDTALNIEQKKEKMLPIVRFHDLRHSHATFLLLAGVPVKVISERLGHSTTRVTQDIYSHVLPQMQEQAADEVDKLLAKKSK